jgi:ABC-type lipoprotein release transport system permease subunit
MAAVTYWLRLDLRRRWRSLLVLALLIALAAGTVMTAAAGARRGATAVDRLMEQTLPATVAVLPNRSGFDWEAVRALPGVEALAVMPLAGFDIDGVPPETLMDTSPPVYDEPAMRTVERPVILDGRLADPSRPDEAVVTRGFSAITGIAVGDSVALRLYTPEAVDAMNLRGVPPGPAEGPAVETTVVGVVRSPWFSDAIGSGGGLFPSPAFLATYSENLLGAQNSARTNALVRLTGGEAAIPAFTAGLERVTGRGDIDVWNMDERFGQHLRDVTRFEANSLRVFAFVSGLSAIVLVGLAIARYSASTVNDLRILRAVGMSPGQARRVAVAGPMLAGLAGVTLGASGAVIASRWFPVGSAALLEPAPGFDVDWLVLGVTMAAVPLVVAMVATTATAVALASAGRDQASRHSVIAAAAARMGLQVPVIVGARMALQPGRGRQPVPVRPALLGSVAGVLGVLAALTFSSGVSDAASNLERFGVVHDLDVFLGLDGRDYAPADEVLTAVASVPGVAGVNDTRSAVARVGESQVAVLSIDPIGEPLDFVVTSGRLPAEAGEITLGPGTVDALGAALGDTLAVTGTSGEAELRVVGTGLMPSLSHNFYTDGGLVTRATYDALFDDFRFRAGFVSLSPGETVDDVMPALWAALADIPGSDELWLAPPDAPPQLAELQQVRVLPVILAGFLALLALGAVGHAVASAVRHRRQDMAVLRALGMTRRQCRGMVVTQACVLALVGVIAGVPVGIALGRVVWRYVAESWPLDYVSPMAWLALLLVFPVALLAANLLAAWPGHRAASMRVGHVLRAE